MSELTFDEKYNVPVEIVLGEFSVEYAGCGTHELLLKGKTSLEALQTFYDYLTTVKGIKTNKSLLNGDKEQ